jgi:protein TonB
MKDKKSRKANLENKKGMFFLIGLVVALGSVLYAFEWESPAEGVVDLGVTSFEPDEIIFIPPTPKEKIEVPKPKIEAQLIELVNNDAVIEIEVEVVNSEASDGMMIDFNHLIFQAKESEYDKEDNILFIAEKMPEFPGGEKALLRYLGSHIRYPVVAQENGIQGKVYVSFVIDELGMINNIEIIRGVDVSIDNEAIRVISSMPRWKPGEQGGKAVKVRYNVPILFKLQ